MRFTLVPRRWYALLLLGDEFDASALCSLSPSPIYVERISPRHTGERQFELAFFHATYPAGVQGKVYTLRTIHRGQSMLLAESKEHDPPRFLYLTELTLDWLRHWFLAWCAAGDDPQVCLNHTFGMLDNH